MAETETYLHVLQRLDGKYLFPPAKTLREIVGKKFPVDRNVIIAQLVIDSPQVYFSGDEIGLKLCHLGSFFAEDLSGTVDFHGIPTYNRERGGAPILSLLTSPLMREDYPARKNQDDHHADYIGVS